jgi:hypothetical protein
VSEANARSEVAGTNWREINTSEDIRDLMTYYGGFHDACIKDIRYTSGARVDNNGAMGFGESKDRQVDIVFQRQRNPSAIELRFIGMRAMCIAGWQGNYSCEIYDCYLTIHNDLMPNSNDNLIIWADNSLFNPVDLFEIDMLTEPRTSFIVADKLRWREI